MARPRHQPDAMQRRQVEAMAGYGVPETEIAAMIGIDPKTLRRHYRRELDHGHTRANIKVAENLFRKATGEGREAVTAAIFWLKVRAGWKETWQTEISGPGGKPLEPVTKVERIILTPLQPLPGRRQNTGRAANGDPFADTAEGIAGPLVSGPGRHDHES